MQYSTGESGCCTANHSQGNIQTTTNASEVDYPQRTIGRQCLMLLERLSVRLSLIEIYWRSALVSFFQRPAQSMWRKRLVRLEYISLPRNLFRPTPMH